MQLGHLFGSEIESQLDEAGLAVLASWQRWRGDDPLPKKSAIDPSAFVKALPGMQIVELSDSRDDFIYRLIGTRGVDERGHNPVGKSVSEGYFAPSAEAALENYRLSVKAKEPFLHLDHFREIDDEAIEEVMLFLPFADEAGNMRFVLVYSFTRLLQPALSGAQPDLSQPV